MIEHTAIGSYILITAAKNADLTYANFSDIKLALESQAESLVKIKFKVTKSAIENSQQIAELEKQRQMLMVFIDNLILAMTEIKSTQMKDISEEQYRERQENIQGLERQLANLKRQLQNFDLQLIYFYDLNQDQLDRYNQKMAISFNKIDELNQQKAEAIFDHVQTLDLQLPNSRVFKENLRRILNHPEVQAAFIAEATGSSKSFGQKFKEWFK